MIYWSAKFRGKDKEKMQETSHRHENSKYFAELKIIDKN